MHIVYTNRKVSVIRQLVQYIQHLLQLEWKQSREPDLSFNTPVSPLTSQSRQRTSRSPLFLLPSTGVPGVFLQWHHSDWICCNAEHILLNATTIFSHCEEWSPSFCKWSDGPMLVCYFQKTFMCTAVWYRLSKHGCKMTKFHEIRRFASDMHFCKTLKLQIFIVFSNFLHVCIYNSGP